MYVGAPKPMGLMLIIAFVAPCLSGKVLPDEFKNPI
jgi:hypothetical protein